MTTKIKARIRTLLRYDADTGALHWIASPVGGQTEAAVWACLQARPAGQKKSGKVRVIVDGRSYQAHRIAFQLHLGRWPRGAVSFVNGDGTDLRWANLREDAHGQNREIRKRHKNNKSGFRGVRWHERSGKWEASVRHWGKLKYLGLFKTPELAAEAAARARRELAHETESEQKSEHVGPKIRNSADGPG